MPEQPPHQSSFGGDALKMCVLTGQTKDGNVSLSRKGRRYIPEEALQGGGYLESILPLQVFATLTVPSGVSVMRFDGMYTRWIIGLQAHNRLTVGFIKAYEREPRRHVHTTLVAAHPLDCDHAALLWQGVIGKRSSSAALVEPYVYGIDGLAYVMKSLDTMPEDVQFSHNLSAFCLASTSRFFGRNRSERRQVRRIRLQRMLAP
jgi:hypothetical protein